MEPAERRATKSHILCLPLHFQGHINPILQFCKRLASRNIKITVLTSASTDVSTEILKFKSIKIESLPDSTDEVPTQDDGSWEKLEARYQKYLPGIIQNKAATGDPVKLVLFDSTLPWTMDIAKKMGIMGAIFYTITCADCAIFYHVYKGKLKLPFEEMNSSVISLPSLPPLGKNDLPSFVKSPESWHFLLKLNHDHYEAFPKADWIFVNSFDSLEPQIKSWLASQYPSIRTTGPTIPSMYLDKQLKQDNSYAFINLFKKTNEDCTKWLDSKPRSSVVYASLGSMEGPIEDQMVELAWGLKNSNFHFLWVVRESEQYKLPDCFKSEVGERGQIVSWCLQLEVLAHDAVGCFVTHSGWNSTLEALSLGVPMVAVPLGGDQPVKGKFVEDVWQAGVRAKANEKGIVTREEMEVSIKEVMVGEKGNEIKKNVLRWKELAKEAMSPGGTSEKNIEEFVSSLLSS